MLLPAPHIRPEGERIPADVARFRIIEQHRGLRELLKTGLALVARPPGDDGDARRELPALLARTNQAFRCHLADEEALLLPILNDDVPVGPWRITALLEEHRRQTAEIDALCAPPPSCTAEELAARYQKLAEALFADMDAEERDLITPDVIRDDGVVIDQCSG